MFLKYFLLRRHSFSYLLLITWMVLLSSCKTPGVPSVIKKQNIPILQETTSFDSVIVQLYSPYKKVLEKDMSRVIAYSDAEMTKGKPESALTNFMADLLIKKAIDVATERQLNILPDMSYFNYGGIRSSIPKGEITVSRAYELMPFENHLVFAQLDGEKVKEFLDALAVKGGDSVSGVRFVISGVKATRIEIGGAEFDLTKSYWIATNNYVSEGGDGLAMFRESVQKIETDSLIRDLIIDYFAELQAKGRTINAKEDGRISRE